MPVILKNENYGVGITNYADTVVFDGNKSLVAIRFGGYPEKKANKNRKHCGLARRISPSVLHSFLKYCVFLQTRAAPNEKMRRHKLFNLLFRRISIQVQPKNAVIRGITSDEISLNKILQTSGAMASVSVCLKCLTLCSAAVKLH